MALPLAAFRQGGTPRTRREPAIELVQARATTPIRYYLEPALKHPTRLRKPVHGDGDLLVIQVGSAAGASTKQKRILRSLGLGRIGKRRLHHGYEGAELHQIKLINHLLEVRAVVSYDPRAQAPDVSAMTVRDYIIDKRPAKRLDYPTGDYVQAELHDHYFSMAWSSDQSAAAFVRATANVLPGLESRPGRAVVFTEKTDSYQDMSTREALKLARWDASVLFIRLDYDGLALTWSTSNDEDPSIGQAGLVSERYDGPALTRLLQATATEHIAALAETLLQKDLHFIQTDVTATPMWTRGDL